MKGYYIEVTNRLLEGKHRKKMGSAVWEFMWLLDHITSISEEGIGKVLGGQPIKLEEIAQDLGVTTNNISLNLIKLKKEGYINVIRTPIGLSISVYKAKKRFGQKSDSPKSVIHRNHGITDIYESHQENNESHQENNESNIRQDNGQDNRQDTPSGAVPTEHELLGGVNNPESLNLEDVSQYAKRVDQGSGKPKDWSRETHDNIVDHLIKMFEAVNPLNYNNFYKIPSQRDAVWAIVEYLGYNNAEALVLQLPQINSQPYIPKSTTPLELKKNFAKYNFKHKESKNKKKFMSQEELMRS